MNEQKLFTGMLTGSPFLASVDTQGCRSDRQNCVLVVNSYQIPTGYRAYILDHTFPQEYLRNLLTYCPESSVLSQFKGVDALRDGDVVDVKQNGQLHIPFRCESGENVLFITNRCNSNCIMCPDSDSNRRRDMGNRTNELLHLIELIPKDARHITITGGEPTLLKWELLRILQCCKERLPNTEFLMLSNGRTLCNQEYRNGFLDAIPARFRLAVPLYGTTAPEHDGVTRSPGGFSQTMAALKSLQYDMEIEIRIVVMKQNYRLLPKISAFIVEELPSVQTVSIMGIELLGNAAKNRNALWVDFHETAADLERAVSVLLSSGIDARIYNYPLCSLPRKLWTIAAKSITEYKVRYQEACTGCQVHSLCGGFFFSTLHFEDILIHPVLGEKPR